MDLLYQFYEPAAYRAKDQDISVRIYCCFFFFLNNSLDYHLPLQYGSYDLYPFSYELCWLTFNYSVLKF